MKKENTKISEDKAMKFYMNSKILQNQTDMKILTFTLAIFTSFLSAGVLIPKAQPLIIFMIGLILFAFSTTLILNIIIKEREEEGNKEDKESIKIKTFFKIIFVVSGLVLILVLGVYPKYSNTNTELTDNEIYKDLKIEQYKNFVLTQSNEKLINDRKKIINCIENNILNNETKYVENCFELVK